MQTDTHDLPNGWIKTTVGSIYTILGGGTPSTKISEYWNGNTPWITSADIHGLHDIQPRKRITPAGIENSATNLIPANTIIVVTRVSLGKIALTKIPLCFSQDSQALLHKTSLVDPNYALYFLSRAVQVFKHQNRGTTISGVTKKQLADTILLLPPLPEQHRIVTKIESIFAQIDACKERLERLASQTSPASGSLAQLKNSVLKQAFEGKLVPQDPDDESAEEFLQKIHQDSRQELIFEKNRLPKGWIKTKMSNLVVNSGVDIVDGPFGSNLKATEYVETGIPLIRLQNVARNQFVNKNIKYITKDKAESLKRHNFKVNDIVITKLGKPLGESCLVPNYLSSGIIVADIVRVRISHDLISRKFLVYVINSDQLAQQFVKYTKGTTRPRVNLTKIRELMIPLPPLPEQHRIVSKIESIFAKIDATDKLVRDSLGRLDLLKRSVLKKAFEGRLVAQNPRDEPAEMLLQRIKREPKPRKSRNVK